MEEMRVADPVGEIGLMARPRFQATPEQRRKALSLAKVGISDSQIARAIRVDRKTLRHSDLGDECFDARLRLKVRLLKHLVKETLPDRGDEYGSYGDIRPLLRRLDRADAGGDDTENEANGGQNDPKDE
jgi:hypothetical protein